MAGCNLNCPECRVSCSLRDFDAHSNVVSGKLPVMSLNIGRRPGDLRVQMEAREAIKRKPVANYGTRNACVEPVESKGFVVDTLNIVADLIQRKLNRV